VATGATIKEIKKAYRKMAIKYHPDRNQGDPEAEAMFILCGKALDCLTDPEKMKLC